MQQFLDLPNILIQTIILNVGHPESVYAMACTCRTLCGACRDAYVT